ncbi:hypothetical protein CLG96_04165 [Sphingomonas oleivorans]|uniref:Uncharacterized protein n=1 Tax=Sphingomonas oleivorans TaxID=1735121 RepID=A0A2T5G2E0_9SPHN|nr:hypothetical protein [Sphingomonas oleivorans]PTQ13308.1 hypothetical protein CLG96_04165 [Sphingomonas oleivorans]
MQQMLMIILSLHVLAAMFWAGSTFALARAGSANCEGLFRPQLGAAAVTAATGVYLWLTLHEESFGMMETLLALGAFFAILAVAVQIIVVGGGLHMSRDDETGAWSRMRVSHRVAAVLLVVATVSMTAARYA